MNTRSHLSLVPAAPAGSTRRSRTACRTARPAGGRAAGVTALAAGLTLGLAAGALATLGTHPGAFASLLLPVAGAAGVTIAAAFRSRAVALRRQRAAAARRQRDDLRRRATRPKPVLVHSRDEFRPVLVAAGSVAQPMRRAA
jgi:hypothetical protein